MRRRDFYYKLPADLIAQYPLERRSHSRLLCLNGDVGSLQDRLFRDLTELLRPDDLLVFNDTRVIPARLNGHKASGGKVEILVERILAGQHVLAHVRASRPPRQGDYLILDGGVRAVVAGRSGEFFKLHLDSTSPVEEVLERCGKVPLPPYITRHAERIDGERYQTVYARHPGAVAAPTAGLHFDHSLLGRLKARGLECAYVTLHVGAGTFQPLRVDRIAEHRMHAEYLEVSPRLCEQVRATRQRGGRIIAVGTTVVRGLETASRNGRIEPFRGETDIFIYPGYRFASVDVMITNFHMPETTLLMLVCAFAGRDQVMNAYHHAVEQQYRFYSYGDAMFVSRK